MFSSYNIARISDVVYSEAISLQQFEKLNIENPIILGNDGNIIFYKQRKFKIRPYDIIFTHTGNLENLLYIPLAFACWTAPLIGIFYAYVGWFSPKATEKEREEWKSTGAKIAKFNDDGTPVTD